MSWDESAAAFKGAAPLGRYHPRNACALCGGTERYNALRLVVIQDTRARGWVCEDVVACERRRHRKRQTRLFGRGAA